MIFKCSERGYFKFVCKVMSAFAVFFLKIATFLGQLGKIRVPACIFRISVRVRVIPELENRDRVDSGNRFFGSGFGYPITRPAPSIQRLLIS